MHLRKSHRKKGPTEKGFFVEAKKENYVNICLPQWSKSPLG